MAENKTQYTGESATSEPTGVPLGGVGAGCMEMGRDGRFRNITINNNRTADTRIPVSPGALLAVRAVRKGRISSRILQADSDLPFAEAHLTPPYTPADNLTWRALYPSAQYRLDDSGFPLDVRWGGMSPVIPYDLDAATLPVVLVNVHFRNPSNDRVDTSVVFNWENLCGCSGTSFPERRGPILPLVVSDSAREEPGSGSDAQEEPQPAGVEFGFREKWQSNAEGHYCLVAKQQLDQDISLIAWNESNPEELRFFWNTFVEEGHFANEVSRSSESHSGAVCCSLTVPAQASRSVTFLLTWYCPRFEVEGVDIGNGYSNRFSNAREVVALGLRHYRYYFKAVEDWHRRMLRSSLPRWLQRMLINSNSVFSTNTLYTKDNQFSMMESPANPITGALDRRLHSSLGTLLFFPELEYREMNQFAEARDPQQPGRVYRNLGASCVHRPNHGPGADELMDLGPKFVLMAYRDFCMTGRRAVLDGLFPRMREAMAYVLSKDRDEDGLPEQHGVSTVYDAWAIAGVNSYTSSLWLAAMRAYTRVCRFLGHDEEAERYEELFLKGVGSFRAKLWREDGGYFRLSHDGKETDAEPDLSDACHTGQLAGQWYADFLCLGTMIPHEEIESALGAIFDANEHANGVAEAHEPDGSPCRNADPAIGDPETQHSWIPFAGTHYACLQMRHGVVDRGLYTIQKIYKNTQVRRGRTFNQPLCWDLKENEACAPGLDRHMGATYIWHVLYALQGFHLNIAEESLWLCPNLPRGVFNLTAPLVTPVCFGWMEFAETTKGAYQQRLIVSFDSPVHVTSIVLRVPNHIQNVGVRCVSPEGTEELKHYIGSDGRLRLVELNFEKPIMLGKRTTIQLIEQQRREPVAGE